MLQIFACLTNIHIEINHKNFGKNVSEPALMQNLRLKIRFIK